MHLIPAHHVATISFVPLDHNGVPAVLDGPLSFELAPGSKAFAAILPQVEDNVIDLQCNEAGAVTVIATGDVLLGSGTETRSWACDFELYEQPDHIQCEVVSLSPIVDS